MESRKARPDEMISNISFSVDTSNVVKVMFKWADSYDVKLAAVFSIENEQQTLDELMQSGKRPTIITKAVDKIFQTQLNEPYVMYKLFPAIFDENNSIVFLDQQEGNCTGVIHKKIAVQYYVTYKEIFASTVKRCEIKAKSTDITEAAAHMFIAKLNGSAVKAKLPVDIKVLNGGCYFYIKKEETIHLSATDDYKNILEIILKQF